MACNVDPADQVNKRVVVSETVSEIELSDTPVDVRSLSMQDLLYALLLEQRKTNLYLSEIAGFLATDEDVRRT